MYWTFAHIGLGLVSTLTPYALIAWFYIVFLTNFGEAVQAFRQKQSFFFIALASYLISFELLARLADTAPLLPYETGKYLILLLFGLLVLLGRVRNRVAILMAILLLPSAFFDLSGEVVFNRIIFNLFAPLGLALGIAVLYKVRLKKVELEKILYLIWLTTLAGLVFILVKTPDLNSIEFTLDSQSETSAGHASNQVSTLMGIGVFISFYAVLYRLKFSGSWFLDVMIMLLFAFQGLLSFSRGGMLVGGTGIAILYYYSLIHGNSSRRTRALFFGALALAGSFVIFQVANEATGGNLLLRYQGETRGTLAGSKEKSLDVLTTGRLSVLQDDLELWYVNPVFGVGCGASQFMRKNTYGYSAHVEISRLLSEHGFLGLLYFILLLYLCLASRKGNPYTLTFTLFVIALLTTFHAAMRTYIPPLFFILSVLNVENKDEFISYRHTRN
jgi:hypothetical protein